MRPSACVSPSYLGDSHLKIDMGAAGIDAAGLPEDLDIHHLIVNSWEDLEAPQNVCIASISTVFNASLAPPGKAVVHAYTAGNEPYMLWEGLDRRSQEYKQLKVWTILLDTISARRTVVEHAYSPCRVGEALRIMHGPDCS